MYTILRISVRENSMDWSMQTQTSAGRLLSISEDCWSGSIRDQEGRVSVRYNLKRMSGYHSVGGQFTNLSYTLVILQSTYMSDCSCARGQCDLSNRRVKWIMYDIEDVAGEDKM